MQKLRKSTLFDRYSTRGVGRQLIPYEDHVTAHNLLGNQQTYDSVDTNVNQIALYNDFKMEVLAATYPSKLQDIISDTPVVRACLETYKSTCSTAPQLEGGTRAARDLLKRLISSQGYKTAQDQAFDLLFRRGCFVAELKFQEVNGLRIPEVLKIHDPERFTFELIRDPRFKEGQDWGLFLKNYIWNRQPHVNLLESPTIAYVTKNPRPNKKPAGRSRVTAGVYSAAVHVKIVDAIKQIMAKSGSPTLSASYDKTQLFGGMDDSIELYEGDVVQWMQNEITQFTEKAKTLPQGDVLVTPGTIKINDYLMPGQRINVQGLEDFKHSLSIDICLGLEVPPAAIGIIQKSSSLNDTNTENLLKKFNNDCHSDQLLVANAFEGLFQYSAMTNDLPQPMSNPLRFSFLFSNVEAQRELYGIQKTRAETEASIIANIQAAQSAGYIDEAAAAERYTAEMAALDLGGH